MDETIKIPILNIYYMICYAWNILTESDIRRADTENFDNVYNLLTSVLTTKVKTLIKKGFYKEYVQTDDLLTTLKGKINLETSINKGALARKQLSCEYDELQDNVLFNQIIKYTIYKMIECPNVSRDLKKDLKKISFYFNNIDSVPPTKINMSKITYNRTNKHYCIILNICQLIYDGLIVTEKNGSTTFLKYLKEDGMAKLFENFVLNFYKEKLNKNQFKKSKSTKIKWNITGESSDMRYLPNMITDIVLETKDGTKKLIIDTKFYKETLKVQDRFSMDSEIKKINSNNIYQINTYVNQDSFNGQISGMLLYPTIDQNYDLNYPISGNNIMIKTVNLNCEWPLIEKRLLEISEAINI